MKQDLASAGWSVCARAMTVPGSGRGALISYLQETSDWADPTVESFRSVVNAALNGPCPDASQD
jgi:hypothetical protein